MVEPRMIEQQRTAAGHDGSVRTWQRFALPSLADIFFVAVFLLLTLGSWATRLLWDTSTGWHIRVGELILRTHSIPRTDPFSYTMAGQPWYAWEWLWDLLNGWIHTHLGMSGVVALSAAVIATTFAALYHLAVWRCRNAVVAAVLTLLAFSAASIHFLARPHVVSWLLLVMLLGLLEKITDGSKRAMWLTGLLFGLWANAHGGFVVGLVLIATYAVAALLEGDSATAKRLATVLAINAVATAFNPYGLKLHTHVVRYLFSRVQMNNIDEFLSPNFHAFQPRIFLLLILAATGALAAYRGVRWRDLLLVLLAVAMSLMAVRNIPLAAILLTYAISPIAADLMLGSRFQRLRLRGENIAAVESRLKGHVIPALVVAFTLATLAIGYRLPRAQWDGSRVPEKAANFVVYELNAKDHVFAPDYWGGYLIYAHGDKGFRVAVDDRSDLYGDTRFRQYLELNGAGTGWRRVIEDWQIMYAIVPTDSSLRSVLEKAPEWRLTYRDDVALVFARNLNTVWTNR